MTIHVLTISDEVVMVGGSSRIPAVQALAKESNNRNTLTHEQTKTYNINMSTNKYYY